MDALLKDYRRYAVEHGKQTFDGDANATNAAYDSLHETLAAILHPGNGAKLFSLYDDGDPWVRLWAAAHTLEIDEARALNALQLLEKDSIELVGLSAEYTIKEWNNGNLHFHKRP